ncbi:MAG: hypothetical protein EA379_01320 [Phycisphaerales bacterium]|nr:MAG: hypothetical protein EA379_01320 [Phycisphaerales bacterium]
MALIPVLSANREDQKIEFVVASAMGDEFVNTGREGLLVRSALAGGGESLAIPITLKIDGLDVAPKQIAMPAGDAWSLFGPFPRDVYSDGDGLVRFQFSQINQVSVAVLRIA